MVNDVFVERIQAHLDQLNVQAERGKRVTAYKVALEVGLDPTYVTNIFRGRKNGTPETLKRLSTSRLLKLSYEKMRSWQALNALEPEVLRACVEELNALELSSLKEGLQFNGNHDMSSVLINPADALLTHIPFKWHLTQNGFTDIHSTDSRGAKWDLNDIPTDIYSNLSSIIIENDQLWPPIPQNTVMLVRPINPPHLLHSGRWYAVQLQSEPAACQLISYEADTGLLFNSLKPDVVPTLLQMNTLMYAFEVIQYQVALTSAEAACPLT